MSRLQQLIKEKGWSNTFFSQQFGKSRSWITDMKNNIGLPDENMLAQIADKLDTTVDYLTDKTDIKNKPATQGDELTERQRKYLDKIDNMSEEQLRMLEVFMAGLEKSGQ